ncbi:hypothetical protein E4U15_003690, partial [Claviceps sp. LM218 group G6]
EEANRTFSTLLRAELFEDTVPPIALKLPRRWRKAAPQQATAIDRNRVKGRLQETLGDDPVRFFIAEN